MISIFGEVYFKKDGSTETCDGFGYKVAYELSKRGAFPAFMTGLGADERGRWVVEQMVEDEIMFDPDMALLPFPTANWGESIEKTALCNVPRDLLLEACDMHSNLNVGFFTAPVFYAEPSRSGFLAEMEICPIPVLQLLDDAILDDATFRKAESLSRFIMTEREDERIQHEYIIYRDGKAELRKDGKTLASTTYDDKFVFVSDVLEALDSDDTSEPVEAILLSFMEKRA